VSMEDKQSERADRKESEKDGEIIEYRNSFQSGS
jgi:hypothetical protein